MPLTLTDRQREVYEWFWTYTLEHGHQPSIRGLGRHFGMSVNGIMSHVIRIEAKGWIKRTGSEHAIRLLFCPDGKTFTGLQAKTDAPQAGQYVVPQTIGTWGGSEND